MIKMLVIDNSPRDAERFRSLLAKEGGEIVYCDSGAAAEKLIAVQRDGFAAAVILWEIAGPPFAFDLLIQCRQRWPEMPVVIVSGALDAALAARAFTLGARQFLEKPLDSESVRACLQELLAERDPDSPLVEELRKTLSGESAVWRATLRQVAKVIPHADSRVLLIGESGTGKELLAQAIHRLGPRGKAPCVGVNIGEIPTTLIESALFGHERGAFTGAAGQRMGFLEEVGEGTLFLDEIGDLAMEVQVKLLRVIQERQFRRLGGKELLPFGGRLIGATNHDLAAAVKQGTFRRDLFHRLAEVTIEIPPLRERQGDVDWLLTHFLDLYRGERPMRLARETITILRSYPFLGNVRELENLVKGALIACEGEVIFPRHLPLPSMGTLLPATVPTAVPATESKGQPETAPESAPVSTINTARDLLLLELANTLPEDSLELPYRKAIQPLTQAFDRVYLRRRLERRRYNITQAAKDAGVDTKTFRKRWKDAGLPPLGAEEESDE